MYSDELIAKEILENHFGGRKNVFTPEVIKYIIISDNVFCEYSKGEFMNKNIFGMVFVRKYDDGETKTLYNYNHCSLTEEEALEYIEKMKKEMSK